MTKEDDFRKHAAETMDLAQKAGSSADKRRLLALAERWLDLADRAHQAARQGIARVRLHPLVRSKLGDGRRESE
jgi:hypothetical protein